MEKSSDFYTRILSHGPSQNTIFLILTRIKEEGRYSEVIRECIKALHTYPDDIRLRNLLAESYFEEGFIGQAEEEINRVVTDIESLVPAFKIQAEICSRQHDVEKAADSIRRYLAHYPDDQEALELLDRMEPAEEESEIMPQKSSEDIASTKDTVEKLEAESLPEAIEPLDDIALSAEEETEAPGHELPEFNDDIASDMGEKDALVVDVATSTLAEIYYDQGQIQDAINIYEKVVLENQDDKTSIDRLARLKAMAARETEPHVTDEDNLIQRKEKMITVLEKWLNNMQRISHA